MARCDKGIKVGLKCRKLSFLHASRWTEDNGTKIGSCLIHYANGQTREIAIRFGVELRDWRPKHDPGPRADGPKVAWQGMEDGKAAVLLFETTWANPLPDVEIQDVDMVSSMTDAAPFLVGLTAQ